MTTALGLMDIVSIVRPFETPLLDYLALALHDEPIADLAPNSPQVFSGSVEVSGTQVAAHVTSMEDELDYQTQEELRTLLRDLENAIINGTAAEHKITGLRSLIKTNRMDGREAEIDDVIDAGLERCNQADTIVCAGVQKRRIGISVRSGQEYIDKSTTFRSLVDVYESPVGVCRIITTRWVMPGEIILLDSSKVRVRTIEDFGYRELESSDERVCGVIRGEYILELGDESAHAVITELDTAP